MVINRIFIKYPLYTQPIRNKDELAAFRMYYKVTQHYLSIEQDERDEIYMNLEL